MGFGNEFVSRRFDSLIEKPWWEWICMKSWKLISLTYDISYGWTTISRILQSSNIFNVQIESYTFCIAYELHSWKLPSEHVQWICDWLQSPKSKVRSIFFSQTGKLSALIQLFDTSSNVDETKQTYIWKYINCIDEIKIKPIQIDFIIGFNYFPGNQFKWRFWQL